MMEANTASGSINLSIRPITPAYRGLGICYSLVSTWHFVLSSVR